MFEIPSNYLKNHSFYEKATRLKMGAGAKNWEKVRARKDHIETKMLIRLHCGLSAHSASRLAWHFQVALPREVSVGKMAYNYLHQDLHHSVYLIMLMCMFAIWRS